MEETNYKIAFIITIVILIFIILVLIVIIIIGSIYYTTFINGITPTIVNEDFCKIDPRTCGFLQLNPSIPTVFKDEFQADVALLSAQFICNVEYFDTNKDLFIPAPLQLVGVIDTCKSCESKGEYDPIFGIVVLDPVNRALYICFRGIRTSNEISLSTLFNQVSLTQIPIVIQPNKFTSSFTPITCSKEAKIHQGFYTYYTEYKDQLDRILVENEAKYDTAILSGHSFGGTQVSFVGISLLQSFANKKVIIYTFGKPRTGNNAFANCITKLFENRFWRVENRDDFMPLLPLPSTPNFADPSHPWIYEQEGTSISYQANRGSQNMNHDINSFMLFLQSYQK